MLKSIRIGVFETNSSSTHSITIASSEDYEKWKNGELLYDTWNDSLVIQTEENKENEDFKTYDKYWDEEYLEGYTERFTTKSGDEIIAFGKYGYDG